MLSQKDRIRLQEPIPKQYLKQEVQPWCTMLQKSLKFQARTPEKPKRLHRRKQSFLLVLGILLELRTPLALQQPEQTITQ